MYFFVFPKPKIFRLEFRFIENLGYILEVVLNLFRNRTNENNNFCCMFERTGKLMLFKSDIKLKARCLMVKKKKFEYPHKRCRLFNSIGKDKFIISIKKKTIFFIKLVCCRF